MSLADMLPGKEFCSALSYGYLFPLDSFGYISKYENISQLKNKCNGMVVGLSLSYLGVLFSLSLTSTLFNNELNSLLPLLTPIASQTVHHYKKKKSSPKNPWETKIPYKKSEVSTF